MNKEIKDYLHLYIGSQCMLTTFGDFSEKWPPEELSPPIMMMLEEKAFRGIKLILRPLSDMNEEECWNVLRLHHSYSVIPEPGKTDGRHYAYRLDYPTRRSKIMYHHRPIEPKSPESTRWLLSKGFDLFGLIDAGLAIDKTKL